MYGVQIPDIRQVLITGTFHTQKSIPNSVILDELARSEIPDRGEEDIRNPWPVFGASTSRPTQKSKRKQSIHPQSLTLLTRTLDQGVSLRTFCFSHQLQVSCQKSCPNGVIKWSVYSCPVHKVKDGGILPR